MRNDIKIFNEKVCAELVIIQHSEKSHKVVIGSIKSRAYDCLKTKIRAPTCECNLILFSS